jgi:hypothetical protein
MAGSGQDGNRKWMAIFLAVAATIAAVAFRRRRRDDGRGAAPLADREDLIEADPEPADDVVQLRSLSRRAQ